MARKRRGLSPEDLEVWARVTDGVAPLSETVLSPGLTPQRPPRVETAEPPRASVPPRGKAPAITLDLAPDPMAALRDMPVRTDRRTHARIAKGKREPDARIDLHGMTAERAHAALTGFILRAAGRGDRLVLVITGKGRVAAADALRARPGVLRNAVPHWLSQAPLAPLIVQIMPAHQRHGGGGAYYVYLKRQR
ncbi:MAG: Smr/MutS family protein [Pseudomonadota bacterium]